MKTAVLLRSMLWLALLAGLTCARANSLSLDFTLDAMPLASSPGQASEPDTVGYWLPNNVVSVGVYSTDYGGVHSRQQTGYSDLADPGAANAAPFGNLGYALPAVAGQSGSVHASASEGHVGIGMQNETTLDSQSAYVSWSRAFALNPFSSLTFSGLFSLVTPEAVVPTSSYATDSRFPQSWVHRASLSYAAPDYNDGFLWLYPQILDRNPLDPTASPQGRTPSNADFSYSVDSFGHIAMTVHNTTAQTLFGSFELNLGQAWTAAPIPEPSMGAMMALGLLGLVLVRRKPRQPAAHAR